MGPGHPHIEGNEVADTLAKEGARDPEEIEMDGPSPSLYKQKSRNAPKMSWK